jgi:hypothetical protein
MFGHPDRVAFSEALRIGEAADPGMAVTVLMMRPFSAMRTAGPKQSTGARQPGQGPGGQARAAATADGGGDLGHDSHPDP